MPSYRSQVWDYPEKIFFLSEERGALSAVDLMFLQIPPSLCTVYCELVGANPASRPNPADVITRCRRIGGYFKNDLVDSLLFLEEIQIKDRGEKGRFFTSLTPQLDHFPRDVCTHKILPQLVNAFVYGEAGSSILAPMFKVSYSFISSPISMNRSFNRTLTLIFEFTPFSARELAGRSGVSEIDCTLRCQTFCVQRSGH